MQPSLKIEHYNESVDLSSFIDRKHVAREAYKSIQPCKRRKKSWHIGESRISETARVYSHQFATSLQSEFLQPVRLDHKIVLPLYFLQQVVHEHLSLHVLQDEQDLQLAQP